MGGWISKERRLALYLRDGLACVWCGVGVEDGAQLSLDHYRCRGDGGRHDQWNLLTSCVLCNERRGKRSVEVFADAVAAYLDVDAAQIREHIERTRRRPIDVRMAAELLERRGSIEAAISDAGDSGGQ